MSSTAYKAYHFKEVVGTREFVLQGFKVKENELMVSTFLPNTAFIANPIDVPFIKTGLKYVEADIIAWAAANKFNLDESGVDTQPPFIVSQTLDSAFKILTLTFNSKINNNQASNAALKALVLLSTDGTTYSALGGSDTVSTPDGTGLTLVVTLNSALSGSTNYVKVGAAAVKDATGNINTVLISNKIDVTVPTISFVPADSATGIANSTYPIITFSEIVFRGSDGAVIDNVNAPALIGLQLTNSSGAVVPFTVSVADSKKKITIIPTGLLLSNQAYYISVAAAAFRDAGGLPVAATHATFTTAT